jgi:hypothetical protein
LSQIDLWAATLYETPGQSWSCSPQGITHGGVLAKPESKYIHPLSDHEIHLNPCQHDKADDDEVHEPSKENA